MDKTVKLIIQGKVQGVFFRANVRRKALELGIVGYAKNLENGDVEVVAQGTDAAVSALEEWVQSSPGAARVHGITKKEVAHQHFSSFNIL